MSDLVEMLDAVQHDVDEKIHWAKVEIESLRADRDVLVEALRDIADGAWNIRHGTTAVTPRQFARKVLARIKEKTG